MDFISATQINSYLMCPLKYRFRYVDGIPAPWKPSTLAFGLSVHAALAWWHEKLMAGEKPDPDAASRIFLADWEAQADGNLRYKKSETHESLREFGRSLVDLYVQKMDGKLDVWQAEQGFETPIIDPRTGEELDFKLKGYFDVLTKDHGILELKTAGRAYTPDTLERMLQLSAYAYAYRQCMGTDPRITVVGLMKYKNPTIQFYEAFRPREGDLWFAGLALDIRRGVEHEVFPPNPGWMCSDCEYGRMCQEHYRDDEPTFQASASVQPG